MVAISPAIERIRTARRNAWRSRRRISAPSWCTKRINLSDTEATKGKLDLTDRPFWIDVLRAIEDPEIAEVAIMASTQVGKTLIMLCAMLWASDNDPAPAMLVTPDQDSCVEARDRCYALASECRPIAPRVPEEHKRNLRHIDLGTCRVYLAWSGSRQRLRGRPCKRVYMTEVDVYRQDKKTGDAHRAARERVKAFRRSKIVYESSPTDETSTIGKLYENSDKRKWLVECPHCGKEQELRFFPHKRGEHAGCGGISGLKDEAGNYKTAEQAIADAHYVCLAGCKIEAHLKNDMVRGGRWQPGEQLGRRAGFHLWSLMSPTLSIGDIVAAFFDHKDAGQLADFFKNWLGLPWTGRDKVPTWKQLGTKLAAVHRRGTVPASAWFLTAGGDVQGDRAYCSIRAWGDGQTSWLVDWREIERGEDIHDEASGMTIRSDLVALAQFVLHRSFPIVGEHPLGRREMRVRLLGIDSNYHTADVHHWHRWLGPQFVTDQSRVRLVRGSHQLEDSERYRKSVIERNSRTGEPYEGGLTQWQIRVNYYKQDLMNRFVVDQVGNPGTWYVTGDAVESGRDYLRQVVNEPRVMETDNHGRTRMVWKPKSSTIGVDYWDTEVYSRAMADMVIGDRDWNISRWPEHERKQQQTRRAAPRRRRSASHDLSAR